MLIIMRRRGEALVIDNEIEIEVSKIRTSWEERLSSDEVQVRIFSKKQMIIKKGKTQVKTSDWVFELAVNESLTINTDIKFIITRVDRRQAHFGVDAPKKIEVWRREIRRKKKKVMDEP